MQLSELAKAVEGKYTGEDVNILGVNTLQDAKEGEISFLFNEKYASLLETTKASAIIIPDFAPELPVPTLRTNNPHFAYARIMNLFHKGSFPELGISEKAHIAASAELGKNVAIAPFVYVGENVKIGDKVCIFPNTTIWNHSNIGDGTIIYSNVAIRENIKIGRNVIIQSGCSIGSDGFGFAKRNDGSYEKIPHVGSVEICDDVEIQANCTIDRASIGNTKIAQGCKLDNMVHVAHSVEIGKNTLFAAQNGIAGSSKIGENCVFAGQVGVAGHVKIGNNCMFASKSGISSDVEDGAQLGGIPAIDANLWKRATVGFKKLPEILKDIRNIKKKIK